MELVENARLESFGTHRIRRNGILPGFSVNLLVDFVLFCSDDVELRILARNAVKHGDMRRCIRLIDRFTEGEGLKARKLGGLECKREGLYTFLLRH